MAEKDLPIYNLSIERFRSIGDFHAGPFGNVNLITGKNNAGKSSLLEAIHLLATEGSIGTFSKIFEYREETLAVLSENRATPSPDDTTAISSLFTGFPSLRYCSEPFAIASENPYTQSTKHLRVSVGWFTEHYDDEVGRRYVRADQDFFNDQISVPMLEIEGTRRKRRVRLDNPRYFRRPFIESESSTAAPCVYLDAFSSRSTGQLASMWDSIALTEAEDQILSALQIISPEISGVSMIGGESSRSRTAIAKSRAYTHPVPLRTFGDGVNRIFGIILSLSCATGGILLIDEIENGLHYSILTKMWRTIFEMSENLGVQIFATSHSWNCIEAFQEAANNHPSKGVLVRLTSRNGTIIPTMLREDELRIAARDQIELR